MEERNTARHRCHLKRWNAKANENDKIPGPPIRPRRIEKLKKVVSMALEFELFSLRSLKHSLALDSTEMITHIQRCHSHILGLQLVNWDPLPDSGTPLDTHRILYLGPRKHTWPPFEHD